MLIEGFEFETDDELCAPLKNPEYEKVIKKWNSSHPTMAVRFVREDREDGCIVLDFLGRELQIFVLEGGDGFFVTTDDEDEVLNSLLTELNDTSTIRSLPDLLSHASKLLSSACYPTRVTNTTAFADTGLEDAAKQDDDDGLLKRTKSATVCDSEGLKRVQEQHIQKFCEATGLNKESATLLLLHFRWDATKARDRLLRDREATLAEAGIQLAADQTASDDASALCSVCFTDDATDCLSCGHGLCTDCWPQFLKCNLESGTVTGDNCLHLKCPGERCPLVIPPRLFQKFLEPSDFTRYQHLLSISFTKENPDVVQCPAPGCELCVAFSKRRSSVACSCGNIFCFACKSEAHAPASCTQAKKWLTKREGAKVSLSLRSSYEAKKEELKDVKPCPNPKCGALTHKETGCHYMSCISCRENWCWQCGDWGGGPSGRPEPHHVGSCNQPKNKDWMVKDASLLDSDGRFAFYHERHDNHMQSLTFAKRLREKMTDVVRDMERGSAVFTVSDVNLLWEAAELLIECRLVLAWTYVWAFFEHNEERRRLFEFVQKDLEVRTEHLSKMIEGRPVMERRGMIESARLRNYVAAIRDYLENIKEYEEVTEEYCPEEKQVEPKSEKRSPQSRSLNNGPATKSAPQLRAAVKVEPKPAKLQPLADKAVPSYMQPRKAPRVSASPARQAPKAKARAK
mmetsp:Transcript_136015/g.254197  ORF Transcript_136015/g.254197 Transcript_136015/m.254197 type:complete len:684 (+) Transcript_136015:73-2124(+)